MFSPLRSSIWSRGLGGEKGGGRRARLALSLVWTTLALAAGCSGAGGGATSTSAGISPSATGTIGGSTSAVASSSASATGTGSDSAGTTGGAGTTGSTGLSGSTGGVADGGLRKAPMRGLVNKGQTDFTLQNVDGGLGRYDDPSLLLPYNGTVPGSFGGTVINATWAELEPQQGAPLPQNNVIDQGLALVEAFNATHDGGNSLLVKLRVSGGFAAPDWAKTLVGTPLFLSYATANGGTLSGTVGEWWTPQYIQAWRAFQQRLATAYDQNPLIDEVAITSCATATDEPFVFPGNQAVLATVRDAGYSDAVQAGCLEGALQDYAAWIQTPVEYSINLFPATDPGRTLAGAESVTLQVMQGCTVANNCLLATHYLNNPLSKPSTNPWFADAGNNAFVYGEILAQEQSGVSVANFQTDAPSPPDWCGTFANGVDYGALSIEVWPDFGGFPTLSVAQVANLAQAVYTATAPNPAFCP